MEITGACTPDRPKPRPPVAGTTITAGCLRFLYVLEGVTMPQDDHQSAYSNLTAATPQAHQSGLTRPLTSAEPAVLRATYKVLDRTLDLVLGLLVKHAPGPLSETQARTVALIKRSIYARLLVEGYISRGRGANRYPQWDSLNARLYDETSRIPAGSGVSEAAFAEGLEQLVGERFSAGNAVVPLINGPASFAQRYELIAAAQSSILLATWKLYGDHTGQKTVDALLARRRREPAIEIRVMVDGNIAAGDPTSIALLCRLVEGGIPVLLYHHDERPFDGFHYKELIIDGAGAQPISITGGMNIGDEYSHAFGTPAAADPNRRQWRDTDVRIAGPNVRDDYQRYVGIWNERAAATNAVEPFGQILTPIAVPATLPVPAARGTARILTVIDEPGPQSRQGVTLAMLRAIRAARRTIDIENAYFMDVPAICKALVDAVQRGVCVRVLTNSGDSVDEAVVVVPILKGLYCLLTDAEAAGSAPDGCQVYVRNKLHPNLSNADTLHSKFMVVDRQFCQVASLNIHTRSLRLEVEGAHYILDEALAVTLAEQFERDLTESRRYARASDIVFPKDLVSRVMRWVNLNPVLA
jgi:cardiolipin synthase